MKKASIGILVISVALIASVSISDYFFPYPPDHSVMRELREEGESIVAKLEKYKSSNKKYPISLNKAGIKLPKARYGGWKYTLHGNSYSLSIGDYPEYLFVMGWDSSSKEWWADR